MNKKDIIVRPFRPRIAFFIPRKARQSRRICYSIGTSNGNWPADYNIRSESLTWVSALRIARSQWRAGYRDVCITRWKLKSRRWRPVKAWIYDGDLH